MFFLADIWDALLFSPLGIVLQAHPFAALALS